MQARAPLNPGDPATSADSPRDAGVVVAIGASTEAFAANSAHDRRVIVVRRGEDLAALLQGLRVESVLLAAEWSELTVSRSRELAEWAARDPVRGCGVVPLLSAAGSTVREPHLLAARRETAREVVLLSSTRRSGVASLAGYTESSERSLTHRLISEREPPPFASTGHGAEYCVRFGEGWLSTDPRAPLPGTLVAPAALACSAAFLNCCASLRLGDSVVPRTYSLAAALHQLGIAVIGSYRNVHALPNIDLVFAEKLLSGAPLGRVVNHLNIAVMQACDRKPTYQLLGDPRRVLWDTRADVRIAVALRVPDEPHAKLLARHDWLDALYRTIESWTATSQSLQSRYADFSEAGRMLLIRHACHRTQPLDDSLARELEQVAGRVADDLEAALLDELASHCWEGRWLEALYGRATRRTLRKEFSCSSCGSPAVTSRYEPFRASLVPVERDECDRCGTLAERFGTTRSAEPLRVAQSAAELAVKTSALRANSRGIVFIHRAPSAGSRPWPRAGGVVRFALHELSFRGRLSVVGLVIDATSLRTHYETLFVAPTKT